MMKTTMKLMAAAVFAVIAYALLSLSGELDGKAYRARVFNEYAHMAGAWEADYGWFDWLLGHRLKRDYYRILSNLSPATISTEEWYGFSRPYGDYVTWPEDRWREQDGYEPYRDYEEGPTGPWRWRLIGDRTMEKRQKAYDEWLNNWNKTHHVGGD